MQIDEEDLRHHNAENNNVLGEEWESPNNMISEEGYSLQDWHSNDQINLKSLSPQPTIPQN